MWEETEIGKQQTSQVMRENESYKCYERSKCQRGTAIIDVVFKRFDSFTNASDWTTRKRAREINKNIRTQKLIIQKLKHEMNECKQFRN